MSLQDFHKFMFCLEQTSASTILQTAKSMGLRFGELAATPRSKWILENVPQSRVGFSSLCEPAPSPVGKPYPWKQNNDVPTVQQRSTELLPNIYFGWSSLLRGQKPAEVRPTSALNHHRCWFLSPVGPRNFGTGSWSFWPPNSVVLLIHELCRGVHPFGRRPFGRIAIWLKGHLAKCQFAECHLAEWQ